MAANSSSPVLAAVVDVQADVTATKGEAMKAADMPRGSSIWGYQIVRRKDGTSPRAAFGGQSFIYYDGGFVADDEQVIDFPSATKMHDYSGGFGSPGEDVWWQEPGGQAITDEQVDEILAGGAQYRLST